LSDLITVYGSYGYTGKLIVQECKARNLSVILAGRDEEKLKQQSQVTLYPFEVVDLRNTKALRTLLSKSKLVIHCAGPFEHTSTLMVEACLETKTHYTDITGEFTVFEMLASLDQRAKQAGIMIMPGVGFDVVPSDCLALHLKKQLPSATKLQLAFASNGGYSRGTALTMIEGLGHGSFIRSEGKLKEIPIASKVIPVDFGDFKSKAVCIPWGDIATAYRTTGIPSIEVYLGVPPKMLRMLKVARYLGWVLKQSWIKDWLRKKVNKRPAGPSDQRRLKSQSYLWGKVSDEQGNTCTSRLQTLNGYSLTAAASVAIATKVLNGNFSAGYFTPAGFYGENLILEIEGSRGKDFNS
jgi:short subunit dehydrogenase-like uncharacterized protein